MKMIRMVVSDILMFLGVVVAYIIVIAGKIAGLEAFSEDALKKEIVCPSCGMDMRIHAKYNADNIAKLEAEVKGLTRSTEMTWAVIQKRKPMIGGHISTATESVIADSEKALEVEKHKHLDTSNWALEQQDRADVAEKQIRKLEAVAEMGPEVSISDGDVWLRFGRYALINVKSIMDRCGPITKKNIRQWRDGILAALEDGE